ncbi:MAG: hypothetical protein JW929_03470 [Anaerolineales bacterium]|nr:hypothetical protein [Anaerolineales bacterium]
MDAEKKPPAQRYHLENGPDLLRVTISPFANHPIFKAFVYLLLLLFILIFFSMILPMAFLLFIPIGGIFNNVFLAVALMLSLPAAVFACMVFVFAKHRIIVEVSRREITVINQYGLLSKESHYEAGGIKNIRASNNRSRGVISFDYGTATRDICPSLTEEDGKSILFAIAEKFPPYKPEMEAGGSAAVERKYSPLQTLGISLFLVCALGGMGTLVVIDPEIQKTSVPILAFVWTIAAAMGVSVFANFRRRRWFTTLIIQLGLTSFLLAYSLHVLLTNGSGWIWAVPIIGAFLAAWVFPAVNPNAAKRYKDAQERLGKKLSSVGMWLFSGLVFLGFFIPREASAYQAIRIVLGVLMAITAIGGGQKFAYQIWNQRISEKQGSRIAQPGRPE